MNKYINNMTEEMGLEFNTLKKKYSFTENFYYLSKIDSLIEEKITPQYVRMQQFNYLYDLDEFMKRQY